MNNSFEQFIIALQYSYNSMTWITWLVLAFGVAKTIQAFIKAYQDNETFAHMRVNHDKTGIANFIYGVIVAVICVVIFFLPYLINYQ